jgi:hypothetical protein
LGKEELILILSSAIKNIKNFIVEKSSELRTKFLRYLKEVVNMAHSQEFPLASSKKITMREFRALMLKGYISAYTLQKTLVLCL